MNIGQSKRLIDVGECFRIYYGMGTSRSLQKLLEKLNKHCPDKAPSLTTLKQWSRHGNWVEQCMLTDQEIASGVKEKMLPEWIEVKSYLLKTLIEQVKKGREAGVSPENTRDMVAAIKEIRAMMGESDSADVNITGIEYVPYNKSVEDNEDKDS